MQNILWLKRISFLLLACCVIATCTYLIIQHSDAAGRLSLTPNKSTAIAEGGDWDNPAIKKVPCTSTVEKDFSLDCGVLTTDISRGQFELGFAVLKIKTPISRRRHVEAGSAQKAPVIYLEGGPGVGGATEQANMDFWQVFLKDAALPREIVLINTRGTKGALPYFECDELATEQLRLLTTSTSISDEIALMASLQKKCVAQYHAFLQAQVPFTKNEHHPGIGLLSSHYSKGDVTELMRALGYDKWHLWGGSYGGRLALLAGQSKEVVSIVLDSPYLFQSGNLLSFPQLELKARKHHMQLYEEFLVALEPKDAEVFPASYQQLVQAVLNKLESSAQPIEITLFEQPIKKLVFTEMDLISIEFTVLYDSALWPSYYWFLLNFIEEPTPFNEQFATQFDTKLVLDAYLFNFDTEFFNLATYTAVECLDNDLPDSSLFKKEVDLVAEEYFPMSTYSSNKARNTEITNWKQFWLEYEDSYVCSDSIFNARNSVHTTAYPNVPLLVLAGDKDPVTPAATLRELPKRDNVFSKVLRNWGHGVLLSYGCEPTLLTKTLEAFEAGEPIAPEAMCELDYFEG
ncbi:alpha/beta fold hydrolase [Saccharophagus degradans]|uniref:alpha/beta hydrolase n=1 Tax=Saccharophagus degradans TaxID=86304 RepID=UPI001C08A649|nr:alpha/beta hydrolase [Saccharophagus degradans]MBU2985591.1 alpha/beta fold hydrolase [Saccharophagus degradans]